MDSSDPSLVTIADGVIRTERITIPISGVIGVRIARASESPKSWIMGVAFIVLFYFLFLDPAFRIGGFVIWLAALLFLGGFIAVWPQIHDQYRVQVTTTSGEHIVAEFHSFNLLFFDNSDAASSSAKEVHNQITGAITTHALRGR